MDCNKEDAIKAQQVAECKIVSEDFVGAKKFILKSQRLFPSLGGLTQMLAVVNVHITAGEAVDELSSNWHQILQVEECADEETVRKQYRKLLLLLHPDKNKYAGAESAFKLVQTAHEAFEKEKELAKASANANAGVSQRFWTICSECKAPSEQLESLEHQYVQCPQCLRSFLVVRFPQSKETYQSKSKEENISEFQKEPEQELHDDVEVEETKEGTDELKVKVELSSSSSSEEFIMRRKGKTKVECNKKAKVLSSTSPEKCAKKTRRKSKQGPTKTKVPKEKRHAQPGGSSRSRKRTSSLDTDFSSDTSFSEYQRDSVSHILKEDGCMHGTDAHFGETSHHIMKENGCMQGAEVHVGDCSHPEKHENANDDVEKSRDAKELFFEKLKSAIKNEFNGGEFQVVEVRQDDLSGSVLDPDQGAGPSNKILQMKVAVSFTHAAVSACARAAASEDCMVGGSEIWEEDQQSVECQVPDNDVFDFDKGKHVECFGAGQIWAVYDDDDGLPRFYAHITQVISFHPFRVRMNWLYPAKPVSEDVKAWTKAGFAYTCGEFTLGKALTRKSLDMFSHIMAHETGDISRTIRIYPQKKDVWALYRAWKPCKGRTRKCEPVEVLEHYCDELGVQVVSLFKVNGYKSIYCRKSFEGFRCIPPSELTRFSHQIPAHYLVGNEFSNLPEDCVDLDTAALT